MQAVARIATVLLVSGLPAGCTGKSPGDSHRKSTDDSGSDSGIDSGWSPGPTDDWNWCPAGTSWEQIAVGDNFECGIRSSGCVQCWNEQGAIWDDGYSRKHLSPPHGTRFNTLAVSSSLEAHREWMVCGIAAETDNVHCWGENWADGIIADPPGTVGATDVAVGIGFGCAVVSGRAVCWGKQDGFFGIERLAGLEVTAVKATNRNVCFSNADGTIDCLGAGIGGFRDDVSVSIGRFTSFDIANGLGCGLRFDGSLACWGHEDYFQMAEKGDRAVAAGGLDALCILRANGDVACDSKGAGPAGGGAITRTGPFRTMEVGRDTVCGILDDDELDCWWRDVGVHIPD